MTTALQTRMGRAIVKFEARYNSKGQIQIYKLPAGDGGGTYEIAGINNRYHPAKAAALKLLIDLGHYSQAETDAADYIAYYTNSVETWLSGRANGAEFYLRDTYFNAGPAGAAKVLQMTLGVTVDGAVGPKTRAALTAYLQRNKPAALLDALHQARWQYMLGKSKNPGKAQFWKGWQNRMNNALQVAKTF